VDIGERAGAALVTVRVRPRSLPGLEVRDGEIVIGVAAPPVDGRATEEARKALAAALGVSPGRLILRSGKRSRTKVFSVAGLARVEVARRLGVGAR